MWNRGRVFRSTMTRRVLRVPPPIAWNPGAPRVPGGSPPSASPLRRATRGSHFPGKVAHVFCDGAGSILLDGAQCSARYIPHLPFLATDVPCVSPCREALREARAQAVHVLLARPRGAVAQPHPSRADVQRRLGTRPRPDARRPRGLLRAGVTKGGNMGSR